MPAGPYLVLRGYDVPGAGDSRGVVPLWPVGRVEGARGFLQPSPAVLVPCKAAQRGPEGGGRAEGASATAPLRHGRALRPSWGTSGKTQLIKAAKQRERSIPANAGGGEAAGTGAAIPAAHGSDGGAGRHSQRNCSLGSVLDGEGSFFHISCPQFQIKNSIRCVILIYNITMNLLIKLTVSGHSYLMYRSIQVYNC